MHLNIEPSRTPSPGSARDIIFVTTPLGLGLGRALGSLDVGMCVGIPPSRDIGVLLDRVDRVRRRGKATNPGGRSPVVIRDLHLADDTALDLIEGAVAEWERPVVLGSAGSLPERLLGYVTRTGTSMPVDLEGLAGALPQLAPSVLPEAHVFCGGWPDAIISTDERTFVPSPGLRRFVRGLQIALPHLATTALLVACAPRGLTVEQVAACIGVDVEAAFDRLATLERFGVIDWAGPHAVPTFGAVRRELTAHEADRRRGAAHLARGLASLDDPDAVIAAAEAGIDQGDSAQELLDILTRAEEAQDIERWERTATALSRCAQNDLRREGLVALARLALLRGEADTNERILAAISHMGAGIEVSSTRHLRLDLDSQFARLNGLDVGSLITEELPAMRQLFPGVHFGLPGAIGAELQRIAAAAAGAEPEPDDGLSSVDAPTRLLRFVTAVVTQEFDKARDLDLGGDELSFLGALPNVALCALEGRFTEAATTLTSQIGPDWAEVAPLHRALALFVATGWSVERTRELAPHVEVPEPGRLGWFALTVVRSRAELLLGRPREAAKGFEELAVRLRALGYHGFVAAFAPDILEATAFEGGLGVLADAEPVGPAAPFVHLAQALRAGSGVNALAEITTIPGGAYRSARLQRLIGRWFLEDGDDERAVGLLQTAAAVFMSLGAPVDLAVTRSLIRRIDPRYEWQGFTMADTRDDGVTRRESDVLALVLDGLTNAEIGAQLHISVATVKRHIASLFRRYGVSTRRQLAHVVRARDS